MKESRATNGKLLLEQLLDRAMASIADYINRPSQTLVLFNPLSWQRTHLVETDIDRESSWWTCRPRKPFPIRKYTPAKGSVTSGSWHKTFPLSAIRASPWNPSPAEPPAPVQSDSTTLENTYYRVTLDPETGAVRSILDKELNRELVDASSPYRFNQYVYVRAATSLATRR